MKGTSLYLLSMKVSIRLGGQIVPVNHAPHGDVLKRLQGLDADVGHGTAHFAGGEVVAVGADFVEIEGSAVGQGNRAFKHAVDVGKANVFWFFQKAVATVGTLHALYEVVVFQFNQDGFEEFFGDMASFGNVLGLGKSIRFG